MDADKQRLSELLDEVAAKIQEQTANILDPTKFVCEGPWPCWDWNGNRWTVATCLAGNMGEEIPFVEWCDGGAPALYLHGEIHPSLGGSYGVDTPSDQPVTFGVLARQAVLVQLKSRVWHRVMYYLVRCLLGNCLPGEDGDAKFAFSLSLDATEIACPYGAPGEAW